MLSSGGGVVGGYDAVGIVRSGGQPAGTDDAARVAAERDLVGEKWARREIDVAGFSLRPAVFREAAASLPSRVAAIGALVDDQPLGTLATSVNFVSADPPLAMVCVHSEAASWPRLRKCPHLGVSVLGESQQVIWRALGRRAGDRFTGVRWKSGPGDSILVHDASLWLDCSVRAELAAGERTIVLLNVYGLWVDSAVPPMLWSGRSSGMPAVG